MKIRFLADADPSSDVVTGLCAVSPLLIATAKPAAINMEV
jgi:hypothetical protein